MGCKEIQAENHRLRELKEQLTLDAYHREIVITRQQNEIERLTKERDDLAQYHGGHYPNCGGMDEADHRCDCGYLQGEAYRELVDKIAEQAAEIERLKKLCAELIGSDMKREVE